MAYKAHRKVLRTGLLFFVFSPEDGLFQNRGSFVKTYVYVCVLWLRSLVLKQRFDVQDLSGETRLQSHTNKKTRRTIGLSNTVPRTRWSVLKHCIRPADTALRTLPQYLHQKRSWLLVTRRIVQPEQTIQI